jgi:DNA mismatch repair protein MSH6
VSYKESDSEGEDDDDVIFKPGRRDRTTVRPAKRRKTSPESEDEFQEGAEEAGYSEDGMLSWIRVSIIRSEHS